MEVGGIQCNNTQSLHLGVGQIGTGVLCILSQKSPAEGQAMVMVPHGAAQRNSRQFFLQQSFQRLIVLFLSLVDKVAG